MISAVCYSAVRVNAEYIVTCKVRHFKHAEITAAAPDAFVKI